MSEIEPVRASATVHRNIDDAFSVFTTEVAAWWPVRTHSIGGADAVADVVLEGRVGGRVFERWHDGNERRWGSVLVWEPPARFVLAWDMEAEGAPLATEVEVAFEALGPATTKVRLEHRGWERLGDQGPDARAPYDAGPGGWSGVLTCFADGAADPACHRSFAVGTNQLVWRLLERTDRTTDDDERMVHAAHASTWHWDAIGEPVNQVRGEWMVSHVYAVLGRAEAATHHARRCLAICEANGIADFDLAYAYEAMARAAAASGDAAQARRHRIEAARLGDAVADEEDRTWFEKDLAAEPWYGA